MTGFEFFIENPWITALLVVALILLGCWCGSSCCKEPLDGHENFMTRDGAYQAALRAGGGREPMYHPPHRSGGSHHFHVHGHGLVNGRNMHYNF